MNTSEITFTLRRADGAVSPVDRPEALAMLRSSVLADRAPVLRAPGVRFFRFKTGHELRVWCVREAMS